MTTTTTLAERNHNAPASGGAPLGNRNNQRHGMRGSGLPKGCGHIRAATNVFRRQIESEVLAARGEITLVDSAYVNTAFRAERHAQLAMRWLTLEAENMSPADRLAYSREVVTASIARDKAIAALNLPRRPDADPWRLLTPPVRNRDDASRDDKGTCVQVANSPGNAPQGDCEAHSA
jgi:hypothetical protein